MGTLYWTHHVCHARTKNGRDMANVLLLHADTAGLAADAQLADEHLVVLFVFTLHVVQ